MNAALYSTPTCTTCSSGLLIVIYQSRPISHHIPIPHTDYFISTENYGYIICAASPKYEKSENVLTAY